jgi:ATP-dependent DNA helicase PIF1
MVLKTGIKDESEIADDLISKVRDLLIEHNERTGSKIETEYNTDLSKSQTLAFEKFKKGDNILMLGAAGCGKSKAVKEMYKYIKKNDNSKEMYITSTTGISAYNIGGITINSFMGIGTGESSIDILLRRLRYKMNIKDRIRKTDILVIDEISMMSADIFEKINIICQTLRKSMKSFGGIQLVITGDFLQLETIFKNESSDRRSIIESELFKKMYNKNTIILKENFRQNGDNKYIDILLRIRKGVQTEDDINVLNSRLTKTSKPNMIYLVSSNKKAQAINNLRLSNIKSDDNVYDCVYTQSDNNESCDVLKRELQQQFMQKGIESLRLRKGCRVLLIKNMDVSIGLVNGSTGTIKDCLEESVIVEFDNGVTENIQKVEWELEIDNSKVFCKQIPLMLAYAITCHRSQGLSLDSAVLDLDDCFCNHMVYVALSRVKSLDGLYLKSFDPKKITVNSKLLEYINMIE